ncbi:hypothetical protein PFISCL1PPCAC_759, partial [Pristionchus fissidentatus]
PPLPGLLPLTRLVDAVTLFRVGVAFPFLFLETATICTPFCCPLMLLAVIVNSLFLSVLFESFFVVDSSSMSCAMAVLVRA